MTAFLGWICFGGFLGLLLATFYIKTVMDPAKKAYDDALARLRQDPHNPRLREEALMMGRRYSAYNKHFNEVRLMNDINAATARAGSEVSIKSDDRADLKPSIEERLEKLDDLRAKGLISDAEHQARREQILGEI